MVRIARRLAGIGASDLANNAAFDSYIGPAREITVDPVRKIISLHDGITPGGQQFLKGGGGDIGINPLPKTFAGIAGDNKVYTLDEAPFTSSNVFVFVGGIRQRPETDYTVNGLALTILSNPDGLEVDTLVISGPFALTTLQGKMAADFATATQGAKADTALQPGATYAQLAPMTPASIKGRITAGAGPAEDLSAAQVRKLIDMDFVDNYSMPLAVNFYTIQISDITGSDDTEGNILHGQIGQTPFKTSDAALLHAKKHLRFTGRLNVVLLSFANDKIWNFNLGANLIQGDEGFPFTIGITSINNADRAQFDSITTGSWRHVSLYVTRVEFAYVTATRMNLVRVNDVTIRAGSGSPPYCFYAAFGAYLHVFGVVLVKEAVTYTSAFIYCQQHGAIMLENGDTPAIFPMVDLTNPGNITSPYKYRCVLGSQVYAASNVYPQLTYATNFYVDAYSFSTQTQSAQDLGKNAASGGPCVADSGNNSAGWRLYADGYCEQWGYETLIGLAVGRTNVAATIVFAKELLSASYMVENGTNNMDVRVGLHGSPTTTGFPLGAFNHAAATAAATARWRVCGYIA